MLNIFEASLLIFFTSAKSQEVTSDEIFGDFTENANFDGFTPDMSKPDDDFMAMMLALYAGKGGPGQGRLVLGYYQ